MKRWAGVIAALSLSLAATACQDSDRAGAASGADLIPRAALFGDPAAASAAINPAGNTIAYLAPSNGYLNIWTMRADTLRDATPLTQDRTRGIRKFTWAETGNHILYQQDAAGDENWRLYVVDVETRQTRALTPEGARADIVGLTPAEPNIVMAAINDRDPAWFDLYRIDILTGERTLVERNTRNFGEYFVDRANRLRLAARTRPDGSAELWTRDAQGRWALFDNIPFDYVPSTRVLGFVAEGNSFLMLSSVDRSTAALVRVDMRSGAQAVLGENARADVVDVWQHPLTREPQAFASDYLRREWRPLDQTAARDIAFLDERLSGDPKVISRSRDDSVWIVLEEGPRTPGRTWLYQRNAETPRLTQIFDNRPALAGRDLARMIPLEIPSRDGLTLVSYLTLPTGADADNSGRPDEPLPLVLVVHGGPWSRDSYGFNPVHQWLADRGYAALSVNYRGSTGFGVSFLRAGNGEWGGRMQDDLSDAVQWAIQQGIAREDSVAIMGQSYGGYAAISGLAFTPKTFACGVSVVGPTNLVSLLNSIPPYWESFRSELYARVGNPTTQAQMLRDRSPLNSAHLITSPLLIAQGARDPRVPRAESDLLSESMRGRETPFVYLLYPDEGHGLARPQNRRSFYASAEVFLSNCLGGAAQPLTAADFEGASVQVVSGAGFIEGLSALAPQAPAQPRPPARPTRLPRATAPLDLKGAGQDNEAAADAPIATRPYGPQQVDTAAPPPRGD